MYLSGMSQAAVEQILGRLLTDAQFRDRFFAERNESQLSIYALSDGERRALLNSRSCLSKIDFERQESCLDDAICRARLTPRAV